MQCISKGIYAQAMKCNGDSLHHLDLPCRVSKCRLCSVILLMIIHLLVLLFGVFVTKYVVSRRCTNKQYKAHIKKTKMIVKGLLSIIGRSIKYLYAK